MKHEGGGGLDHLSTAASLQRTPVPATNNLQCCSNWPGKTALHWRYRREGQTKKTHLTHLLLSLMRTRALNTL